MDNQKLLNEYQELRKALNDCSKKNNFEGMVNILMLAFHNYKILYENQRIASYAPICRWP